MFRKILKNKNLLTVLLSCIVLSCLFASSDFLKVLNKSLQNEYYSLKNEFIGLEANKHIVIVEIDDETFKKIGRYPFPRSIYAQALNNIESFHPASVAFDILFLDPSTPEEDSAFSQALGASSGVVLGAATEIETREVQKPYFTSGKYGFLFPNINSSNKTVYTFSPNFQDAEGNIYEHFTIAILRAFYTTLYEENIFQTGGILTQDSYNLTPTLTYPLSAKNSQEILINFIAPEKFTRISFSELLSQDGVALLDSKIDFRDKIILIGPAAEGLKDDFFTPNGNEYGVNIHANILNTLIGKNFMMYFDTNLEWILIFFIIILSIFVNLSSSRYVLIWGNMLIIGVFWFFFPLSIFLGTNLILNYPSQIIFSLLLSLSLANVIKYLIEDKNKQRLNKALSEYVGTHIAQEILFEEGKVNLDGEEKNLLYFFSDIEGFTSLSEKLSPKDLVLFLREYLSEMTSCIMEKGGYVDKFEGDAIMAFWGAFGELEPQNYVALCEAALKQQKILPKLTERWKQKLEVNLAVRMGLHGGDSIVGNIGAFEKKMDFTALGDNVNLASRLEGVNKFYGTYICVSEVIYEQVKEEFFFRFLDEIQVKGKEQSIKIYELLGRKEDISLQVQERCQKFESAQNLYRQQKFQEAKDIFDSLIGEGDIPSETYSLRCSSFLETPPLSDWKGIWKMMEK